MANKLFTGFVVLATIAWAMGLAMFAPVAIAATTLTAGTLIQAPNNTAVYYYGSDGKRYVFPHEKYYKTWYADFKNITTITADEMGVIEIGGNVSIRPGTKLVKFTTAPSVYAVEPGSKLKKIGTEAAAKALYGANWAKNVIDLYDTLYTNYAKQTGELDGTAYPVGAVVKPAGDYKYYVSASGWRKIASDDAFVANKFSTDNVVSTTLAIPTSLGTDVTGAVAAYTDVAQIASSETSGTTATTAAGTLTAALATTTPAAGYIVADTTSGQGTQFQAAVASYTLTATTAAVKVKTIKVKKNGLSTQSDFANVYLYDENGALITDAPSYSLGYYTFTVNKTIDAGASKTYTVKLDLANGTTSGKTIYLTLESAADIAIEAGTVTGTFPISGNTMNTATVSDLGQLTLTAVNATPGSTIEAGLTAQTLFKFTAASTDQKIKISKMRFVAIGTLEADTFANLYLTDGTGAINNVTVAALDANKAVVFDFSANPYLLDTGVTKTFELKGDITKGTSRTFYFEIESASDVVAMDYGYNVQIKPNKADTWTIIYNTTTSTISAGSISVTLATNSPSGNIAKGATNQVLAKWKFKAVGEDIKVTTLTTQLNCSAGMGTNGLDNGMLLLDGVQVGTTTDLASNGAADTDTTFNFGSTFIVKSGTTSELVLKADIKTSAGGALTAGWAITPKLKVGSANFLRMMTGTTGATGASSANALTVAAATITAYKNATVAAPTLIANSSNVVIGSYQLTAGSAEDVNVSSITVIDRNAADGANGSYGLGSAFANVGAWYNDGTGYKLWSQSIATPSATAGVSNTFNFSTPIKVTAGKSVTIDLKADVLTNATLTNIWTNGDATKVSDISGLGVVTNGSATATAAIGQGVTLAAAGTLTVALSPAPTNPTSTYVVAGKADQTVAGFKFSASNTEDLSIYRVKVVEYGAGDTPGNVKNLRLFVDGKSVAQSDALIDTTVNSVVFESVSPLFTVTKNSYKHMTLVVDGTETGNGSFAAAGSNVRFKVIVSDADGGSISGLAMTATSTVSAKGALSNTYALAGNNATALEGNNHKFVKSKPTFALFNPLITQIVLIPNTVEVMRFTITADSAGDVVFDNSTATTIQFTITEAGTGGTEKTADLYDAATNTIVATQLTGLNLDTVGVLTFNTVNSTIAAGTSKTYYVTVNLAGYTTTGNSFKLTIGNAAADLIWGDTTALSVLTNANFAGIGLPLVGPVLVK
ncbi:hypothetical protein HY932_03070 [Candidatus Falkowbacteria bacterium]|nr:hypothetical protein [Candidatus Falkowbacteria bacterium]